MLDPLEEQLDLPAGLVDSGDRARSKPEVVGQEHEVLAGFGIAIANPPQRDRAASRFAAVHLDGLVAGQAQLLVHRPPLDDLVTGVSLLTGDEGNCPLVQ